MGAYCGSERLSLSDVAYGGKKISQKELAVLFEDLWKQWDKDNSGSIEKSEINGVLATLKRAEIARNAKQFETNKADFSADDVALFKEKQAIREKTMAQLESGKVDAEIEKESADFFAKLDLVREGDGKVSKEEMLEFFTSSLQIAVKQDPVSPAGESPAAEAEATAEGEAAAEVEAPAGSEGTTQK